MSAPERGSLVDLLNKRFDELLDRADEAIAAGAHRRAALLVHRANGVSDALDLVHDWNDAIRGAK